MKSTRHRSVASALLLLCATSSAFALGFGRARTAAFMGQSLEFSVPVRLEAGEDLTAECLGIEVYYGENRLSNAAVDHVVEPGASANERLIRVRVEQPVDEPVVTLYVAAGCTGRVTRKFVAFADPPTSQVAENAAPRAVAARPAAVAVPLVTPAASAPVAAPAPAPMREPARRRATAAAAGASAAAVPTEASVVRPATSPRVPRSARATADRPLTPQLKLDLIDAEARTLPALKLALDPLASAPDEGQNTERRAAAAALWRALNASPEDLLRDQQRLTQLETQLATMQADSKRTRELLESVEARLAGAEAQRHDNPLTWGLAGLSALLAAAVGVLLWQRRREGANARWWSGAEAGVEPAPAEAPLVDVPPAPAAVVVDAPAPAAPTAPVGFQTPTVPAELPTAPVPAPPPVVLAPPVAAVTPVAAVAPRQVSVEELIDLEQQAEFFVVLGQDEAAIDLLQTHLRSDANGSPLPYLKLLEIHRRRDEKDAYEQVRAQFNSQFNAWAPDWDQDLGRGRALEDYPGVLERLILIWPSPAQALEVLQASLLRPDGVDANTFDLPAYRELLFLYAVVRDLVERGEVDTPGGIDLLLDDEPTDGQVDIPLAQVSEPVLPLVALEIEPSGSPLDVQRPPVDQGDAHVIDFEHIDLQPLSPKDKA